MSVKNDDSSSQTVVLTKRFTLKNLVLTVITVQLCTGYFLKQAFQQAFSGHTLYFTFFIESRLLTNESEFHNVQTQEQLAPPVVK